MKKLDIRPDPMSMPESTRGWHLYILWVAGYAVCWVAAYLMLVAVAVLQSPGETSSLYRVTRVEICDGKGCTCNLIASVQGHPAFAHRVCIEDVDPEPVVGDSLEISGHFTPRGVYITDISHASPR